MHTYFSKIARRIDNKGCMGKEGYLVLCERNQKYYSLGKPQALELVSSEDFIHALVEGCKAIVRSFADSADNGDVYMFNLYTDENANIYVYMNTLPCLEESLRNHNMEDYQNLREINSLKFNQADLGFEFWQEHMGDAGRIINAFEDLAYSTNGVGRYYSESEENPKPIIAFEADIIEAGYYALAVRAVEQLIAEDVFAALNKTKDFVAFASTDNGYLDYSLVMRKTISLELFYGLFPYLQQKDMQYQEELHSLHPVSVCEALDYWHEAVNSPYLSTVSPYKYVRCEYDIFLQLERFGNDLAKECLRRLNQLCFDQLEQEEINGMHYYVEALYFSGKLTDEQKEMCRMIACKIKEARQDLDYLVDELKILINT
ncbi:MAG: hypothetical protein K0R57_1576 [Paenibacillaceae bacterium]|nr:hypothetical protein [Paenibacillaceae bacterium]